mgnify:CR=1 FL=1
MHFPLQKGGFQVKTFEIVVHNPTGLHARPAKVLVNTAKTFKSAVRIGHGAKQANAKSLISVLTLGVESGGVVRLEVEGEDEDVAALALQTIIEQGLGEGTGKLVTAPVPEVQKPAAVMPAPAAATAPCASEPGLPQRLLRGIPAAPGFGIGPIFRLERAKITVSDTFTGVNQERALLQQALEAAREQLQQLRAQLLGQAIASEAAIFEVHLELLEDPDLLEAVYANIERQHNAAQAWQAAIEARARMMAALDDPLLAARAADIHDVGYRVLRLLVGADTSEAIQLPDYPVLVVAHDISPSDTASLDPQRVLGFCTAVGGPTAHAAIIARAMGFPAVVSVGEDVLKLDNGTLAILDGVAGTLVIEPDAETLARAQEAQRLYQARRLAAQASSAEPAVTRDGHRVEIVANIGGVADARKAHAAGAEGVGLLRTEFLFLDRASAPTETEQFEVYRDIALALEGRPVIIRTLDIGGDKPLPYINLAPEENPFLGERGIRLCLARPDLLRQQVRAILRAAAYGKLRIMFPMVADLSEWQAARAIVEELRAELYAPEIEVGIMVEVPSAALLAEVFAREVDFFSIGTNDLTQYTLAMDRTHPSLAGKSDGLHPAVLRLIQHTVEGAHAAGKWVGVCGELGADPQAVPILLGLGVDELSISVPAIPMVKAQVRDLTLTEAQRLAQEALACATAPEVRRKVAGR